MPAEEAPMNRLILTPFYAKTVGCLVDDSLLERLRLNCYGLSNTIVTISNQKFARKLRLRSPASQFRSVAETCGSSNFQSASIHGL